MSSVHSAANFFEAHAGPNFRQNSVARHHHASPPWSSKQHRRHPDHAPTRSSWTAERAGTAEGVNGATTSREQDMDATEPKGARATKLDEILDMSIKQTTRACSYEKLVSCFPTLARTDPETLKHAQEQVTEFLRTACRSEFDKILRERDAIARLNELDELIADARSRKEGGQAPMENPSELGPEVVLRAHLLPVKRAELAALNDTLQSLQQENAEALERVEEQRREIELRTKVLRDSLATLDSVSAKIDPLLSREPV